MVFEDEIKKRLNGKRLLLLGGGLWKDVIQKIAQEYNITLIATGNNPSSGIFQIADEVYTVNSTDSNEMKKLIFEKKIDGVYMGGSEIVISSACKYLNELELPCYCTKEQWEILQDKSNFKALCIKHGLPVVEKIDRDQLDMNNFSEYPIITKPTDGCGSSGFSLCHNLKELKSGYKKAKESSPKGSVIIERFVKNEGVVVFYTVSNGKLYFSGIEDKYPVRYDRWGSYVGGLFVFESKLASEFCSKFEDKISSMILDVGIKEGSFWIEVFYDGKNYYFNEVGYRYGGSASIYPVDYMHGINQVAVDIYYALTGKSNLNGFVSIISNDVPKKKKYAVYPVYASAGIISYIHGIDELENHDQIVKIILHKTVGDTVSDTGTFSQVVALVHFVFNDESELISLIDKLHDKIKIIDQYGKNMIFRMLNTKNFKLK